MDKEKLKYYKEKLLKEKEETIKSLEMAKEKEEDINHQLNSELSTYGNHPGDIGTETYMKEQEIGFKEQLKVKIQEINQSLEDIETGSYGICDNCDELIQEERLEIIPYAKTCLKCSGEKNS